MKCVVTPALVRAIKPYWITQLSLTKSLTIHIAAHLLRPLGNSRQCEVKYECASPPSPPIASRPRPMWPHWLGNHDSGTHIATHASVRMRRRLLLHTSFSCCHGGIYFSLPVLFFFSTEWPFHLGYECAVCVLGDEKPSENNMLPQPPLHGGHLGRLMKFLCFRPSSWLWKRQSRCESRPFLTMVVNPVWSAWSYLTFKSKLRREASFSPAFSSPGL